jgi:hypothetical protein
MIHCSITKWKNNTPWISQKTLISVRFLSGGESLWRHSTLTVLVRDM